MSIKQESKRASARSLKSQIRETPAIFDGPWQDPRRDRRIRIELDFLNANLHRRIRLTELAEAAKISPSRLSHLFKTEMGIFTGAISYETPHAESRESSGNQPAEREGDNGDSRLRQQEPLRAPFQTIFWRRTVRIQEGFVNLIASSWPRVSKVAR